MGQIVRQKRQERVAHFQVLMIELQKLSSTQVYQQTLSKEWHFVFLLLNFQLASPKYLAWMG